MSWPANKHTKREDRQNTGRNKALAFLDDLGEYNSADCPDDEESDLDTADSEALKFSTSGYDKAAAIESMSLGSLKALYR